MVHIAHVLCRDCEPAVLLARNVCRYCTPAATGKPHCDSESILVRNGPDAMHMDIGCKYEPASIDVRNVFTQDGSMACNDAWEGKGYAYSARTL